MMFGSAQGSAQGYSSAASDVYKREIGAYVDCSTCHDSSPLNASGTGTSTELMDIDFDEVLGIGAEGVLLYSSHAAYAYSSVDRGGLLSS